MSLIFLSWSKEPSRSIANAFHYRLPYILQGSKSFFSPEKIGNGMGWFEEISDNLKNADCGIIFLSSANLNEEWLLFEGGGLYTHSRLFIILCDLEPANIKGTVWQNMQVAKLGDTERIHNLFLQIRDVIKLGISDNVLSANISAYYNPEIYTNSKFRSSEAKEISYLEFVGEWQLSIRSKENVYFSEIMTIDELGKYHIRIDGGTFVYYFQLQINQLDSEYEILKYQLIEGRPSNLHSTERLKWEEQGRLLRGYDSPFENTLEYRKIS